MDFVQLLPLIVVVYAAIATLFATQFNRGLAKTKARLTYWTWYGAPRFTARDTKGHFMANKVGIFYIVAQGIN